VRFFSIVFIAGCAPFGSDLTVGPFGEMPEDGDFGFALAVQNPGLGEPTVSLAYMTGAYDWTFLEWSLAEDGGEGPAFTLGNPPENGWVQVATLIRYAEDVGQLMCEPGDTEFRHIEAWAFGSPTDLDCIEVGEGDPMIVATWGECFLEASSGGIRCPGL
jgi:hypothetical protein